MTEKAKVVFTPEQVKSINEFQQAGVMHPFTCGDDDCRARHVDSELVADTSGLKCPHCGYTQDWAHGFMADGSWKEQADMALGLAPKGDQPDS